MADEVILKVLELSSSTQYGKAKIVAEPVGDLLYSIPVQPEHFEVQPDGTKVFNQKGINHLIKAVQIVLVVETEGKDF